MPKKTTKTKNIRVKTKKQGYWINKENKKSSEKILKTKDDKALVKRNRSGYDYYKTTIGYELTKTELKAQFAKRQKTHPQATKQDLARRAKNTLTAPVFTLKYFFDFTKKDINGIDTPQPTSKEIAEIIMEYETNHLRLITLTEHITSGEKRKGTEDWVKGERSSRRQLLQEMRDQEYELNKISPHLVKEVKSKVAKMDNLTKENIKEKKQLAKDINKAYHTSDNIKIYENKIQTSAFAKKKQLLSLDDNLKQNIPYITNQTYLVYFKNYDNCYNYINELESNLNNIEAWVKGETTKPFITTEDRGKYEPKTHKVYSPNIVLTLSDTEKKSILQKVSITKKQIEKERKQIKHNRKMFVKEIESYTEKDNKKLLESYKKYMSPKQQIDSFDRIFNKFDIIFNVYKKAINKEISKLHDEINADYPAYDKVLELEKEKEHQKVLAKKAKSHSTITPLDSNVREIITKLDKIEHDYAKAKAYQPDTSLNYINVIPRTNNIKVAGKPFSKEQLAKLEKEQKAIYVDQWMIDELGGYVAGTGWYLTTKGLEEAKSLGLTIRDKDYYLQQKEIDRALDRKEDKEVIKGDLIQDLVWEKGEWLKSEEKKNIENLVKIGNIRASGMTIGSGATVYKDEKEQYIYVLGYNQNKKKIKYARSLEKLVKENK